MPTVALCAAFHSKECSRRVHKPMCGFLYSLLPRSTVYVAITESRLCGVWTTQGPKPLSVQQPVERWLLVSAAISALPGNEIDGLQQTNRG